MMIKPDFEELRRKLTPQVGPPTYPGANKRQPTLNQQFFARLAKEVFNPIYEKIEELFYIYWAEYGLWEPQDTPTMLERISLLMMRYANETGDTFVIGFPVQTKTLLI